MKRLIILAACAALILSGGCRRCGWGRRGAPCRSSLSFDPYTAAPAACGVDAFAGEPLCGQDVAVGYGMIPGCPECEGTVVGGEYYGEGTMAPVPADMQPSVPIDTAPPMAPIGQ